MTLFVAAYLIVWLSVSGYIVRLGMHQYRFTRTPAREGAGFGAGLSVSARGAPNELIR